MKLNTAILLLLALLPTSKIHAQDLKPGEQAILLVRLENLIVRVPETAALDLKPALSDPAQAKAAQERVLKMIRSKEAELVDWPTITTRSGIRAVSENSREVRYPTEYAAPQILTAPISFGYVVVDLPAIPRPAGQTSGQGSEAAPGTPVQIQTLAGVPTTFESRNAGISLEAEPVIDQNNNRQIELQVSAQRQTFTGYHHSVSESAGVKVSVETPEFDTAKVSTNLSLHSGIPTLIGFYKLAGKKRTVELSILTATVVESGRYIIPPQVEAQR